MAGGLLGKKVGMTRLFDAAGNAVPVTVLQVGPCYVLEKRTYGSRCVLQLGYEEVPERKVTKPLRGHFAKCGVPPLRFVREVPAGVGADAGEAGAEPGTVLDAGIFREGELVNVTGTTKGKGFAGVMKRYGFHGMPATHGHTWYRRTGSRGASSDPSRTYPGSGAPGRMGGARHTARNLEVVKVDPERNLIAVKGAVPGACGGYVVVTRTGKTAKHRVQRADSDGNA